MPRFCSAALTATAALAACIGAAAADRIQSPAFEQHVAEYLQMRRQATEQSGRVRITGRPRTLTSTEDELRATIRELRTDAREGAIFTPEVATVIRAALRAALSAPDGAKLRAAIADVQPGSFTPTVNARYPAAEPRSTMPPQILAILPRVPEQLSFRFVARDLLLIDRNAALVVDVLRDAVPATGE